MYRIGPGIGESGIRASIFVVWVRLELGYGNEDQFQRAPARGCFSRSTIHRGDLHIRSEAKGQEAMTAASLSWN
jgi:hypothetical protein